jgi:acetyl-CoA acyltransferase
VTDGAVALLVMSEERARKLGLEPLARIAGHGRAGLAPELMGLGPVHAAPAALREAGVSLSDLARIEINEAFAAQVLACERAFASARYCREELGLSEAIGEIDPEILNIQGGAIALGHPIAATGARLLLTLAHQLRSANARYGMAALCIGGGQGQAVVLEVA